MASVDEIRSNRPRTVLNVRVLAVGAAILWLIVTLALVGGTADYPSGLGSLGIVALLLLVSASVGVAKGRRAARMLLVAALVVLYLVLLPYCVIGFVDRAEGAVYLSLADILACILAAAALILAFRPDVSTYIRRVEGARRAG